MSLISLVETELEKKDWRKLQPFKTPKTLLTNFYMSSISFETILF